MVYVLRKYSLLLVFISIVLCSNSQFHERIYFNNLYNENVLSGCKSIIELDSGYYGCGSCIDSLTGIKTIVILKLNYEGDLVFWKEFRRNNTDHYAGHESSFHYIGNNYIADGGTAGLQGHLRKINLNGDTAWTKLYSSKLGNQMIMDYCRLLPDNGFICTGLDDYPGDEFADVVLMKTDSLGNELWRHFYGWETEDRGFKVLLTNDNCYIISGYTYDPGYEYSGNALFIKTDSTGTMEWYRTPGHTNYRDGYGSVTIAPDGNYVFGYAHAVYQGPPYPVPESFCKIKFIKYGQNGDTIWEKIYGQAWQVNMLRNIITLHDGSFLAVGYANSDTVNGVMQGWLFKINQFGDSIWYRDYRHYPSSSLDYLYDVYETSDHSIIACGVSSYAEPGPDAVQRMWILKLDSAGCTEPGCDSTVGVKEHGGMEAWQQGGLEIWPNPASGEIHVRLNMDVGRFNMDMTFEICDIFGRTTPTPTLRQPGEGGELQFDVSLLPPGIYLAVVREGTSIVGSGKFMVVRE